MSAAPQVVHRLPGRVRARVDGWPGGGAEELERRALAVPGVQRASASPATRNLLVVFDEARTDWAKITRSLGRPAPPRAPAAEPPTPSPESVRVDNVPRLVGATAGLGVLLARRLLGRRGPPADSNAPFVAVALLGVAQGVPPLRRAVLGARPAAFVFDNLTTGAQTLAGKALDIAVSAGSALQGLTAQRARAEGRRAYAAPPAASGTVQLREGDRVPGPGVVLEGFATATGPSGLPEPLLPGARAPAGGRVRGGSVLLAIEDAPTGAPRAAPERPPAFTERYTESVGVVAVGAAVLAGLLLRSPAAALMTLQLLNPRPAEFARESADDGAVARAVRGGAAVLGDRPLRPPDLLVVTSPRILTDGLEVVRAQPVSDDYSASDVLRLAGEVATAAGSPWGRALPAARIDDATDVSFDGRTAAATLHGAAYALTLSANADTALLLLAGEDHAIGRIVLRPRLASATAQLVRLVPTRLCGDGAARLAERADIESLDGDPAAAVRALQAGGARVAVLDDTAPGAFDTADLAIALVPRPGEPYDARADALVPDLATVATVLDAGARAGAAERDGTILAIAANAVGVAWALRGAPSIRNATRFVTAASAGALLTSYARLTGGARQRSAVSRLTDPRPERWGRMPVDEVLAAVRSSKRGLSTGEAAKRRARRVPVGERGPLAAAVADELRSPATAVLALGGALSLSIGEVADAVMIAGVVVANTLIDAWQQARTRDAVAALEHLTAAEARVLRDGAVQTVPADEVVVGDVLLFASGDHVPADARVLSARGLQIDEAALTGESLPVGKSAANGDVSSRILLDGSDVTVGTGRAVAVAVGSGTRLGSIAAVLEAPDERPSPLATRLERMMRQGLPIVAAAGAVVVGVGVLRGRSLATQIPVGVSIAIAAIPEGLPLLAGMASAAAARRLASRQALVRTLPAVDALGRVDVACTDKTGTLTFGRLAVRLVAGLDTNGAPRDGMDGELANVLRAAAVASPHPDASDATAHPTDVAVTRAADAAGLGAAARVPRAAESSFDPERAFHAARADGRLWVKGAAEVLAPRCVAVRRDGEDRPLEDPRILLERAVELARRGLRVLMVAEGPGDAAPDDPQDLVALGFVGIADPLRPGVRGAVRRCHAAGVRVMMLTGDHPETALAIAREAGLGAALLTGPEIAELEPDELDQRLDEATVVARITPVDKVRIVESLQRRGHTVAMTGDGVNDAPALRLADVGVAMGRHGTEVARQAADVILTEDDFSVLTQALVEGRGFWRNLRRALGLLLGGNLGEIGLVLGAAVLGLPAPLTARQILAVNLVTDVLPAIAVVMQPPEHRDLAGLAREGTEALDRPLRRAILTRAAATAVPSLAAYAVAGLRLSPESARGVGFGAICSTQLALTVVDGSAAGALSRPVATAVFTTGAMVAGALALGPAQAFLGFGPLGLTGWLLVLAGSAGTVAMSRAFDGASR